MVDCLHIMYEDIISFSGVPFNEIQQNWNSILRPLHVELFC